MNKIVNFLLSFSKINAFKSLYMTQSYSASKMQASSTRNQKDSRGKRLGIKKFGGEEVFPGDIIARQRGFRWHPGDNTYYGRDHTIHAKCEGKVKFVRIRKWGLKKKFRIDIIPQNISCLLYTSPSPRDQA
eukprot:TRINITY_DN24038_c0_g1_i2.p1 TRINITY_DN24038_c0_g1~~TRINITY_DN24038_c0_g1_i2.p1  ORF type:complete len:131 (+),score=19.26 TRINITY_DN24038_c0_g1_i2:62-454(+)